MSREFDLYIVPTPIGNISDITLRAIEILKAVDLIACEDTRTTQNILNHYGIRTKTVSYHKFNEKSKVDELIDFIKSGKKLALVSDAGTPMICDPGCILLKKIRENNITVTALAGACAVSTFLSQIPRENEIYTFVGFFPKTEQKATELLNNFAKSNLVFYESPNRIIDTLNHIKSVRGSVQIALSRELTKLFEETVIDKVENVINHYKDGIKGELVCMIFAEDKISDFEIDSKIKLLKDKGYSSKDISIILSTLYNENKNDIYKRSMK